MANIIRNMNFKPILEKINYERLGEPAPSSTVNMRVWDVFCQCHGNATGAGA